MNGNRPVPIGTLDSPTDEVVAAALVRIHGKGSRSLYLVLRDGEWLLGPEHARFIAEAECGRGRVVAMLSRLTPVDRITRIVEDACRS